MGLTPLQILSSSPNFRIFGRVFLLEYAAKIQFSVLPTKFLCNKIQYFVLMTPKNEISNRFIEAYEALLSLNIVSDKRDFATQLGISASMITEISKGRSSVGVTAIQNIVSKFNINADWLLTGEGEMQIFTASHDQIPVSTTTTNTDCSYLINLIKEQAEEIGRLKECIRQLTVEKEKHVSPADIDSTANVG